MMNKTLFATTAAIALAAIAANAEGMKAGAKAEAKTDVSAEPGIVSAVSNTAGAAYEKSAQGVNAVKGSYHENMAESNAKAAKENLATGDFNAAATDAKDAAEHQSAAMDAKGKAAASKSKAGKDWAKAKAAVSTSTTTK
jgi:hypothetical protein